MTYRLVVDGNLYSRKGVFNENLFASSINTSAINAYNDNSALGNSTLSIGNYTNTLNIGGIIQDSAYRTNVNFNGDTNVNGDFNVNGNFNLNGIFNVYGSFNFPNSFDYVYTNQNVSIGYNQLDTTTINLGNITKTNLNTNVYGSKTRISCVGNNCVEINSTATNTTNIDFYSNDNTSYYGTRINSTGGNITTNGGGTMNIYSSILNLPSTITANSTNLPINLLTTQTTGGDIILGSSSVNVSVRGSRLSIPNNVSSSNPGTTVNLFTNQTTGGDINIGSNNASVSLSGTLFLNGFVGQVAFFAMTSAPTGWFKCNGSAISRTQYSALFAVINTTYGSGDGSTTFNLPDFRGYFLRGLDDGKGVDSGRSLNNIAQTDDVKPHNHTATDSGHSHTATQPAHNHTINDSGHSHTDKHLSSFSGSSWGYPAQSGTLANDFSVSNSTTGITINNAQPAITVASSTANITVNNSTGTETRPKNFALLICIKY